MSLWTAQDIFDYLFLCSLFGIKDHSMLLGWLIHTKQAKPYYILPRSAVPPIALVKTPKK